MVYWSILSVYTCSIDSVIRDHLFDIDLVLCPIKHTILSLSLAILIAGGGNILLNDPLGADNFLGKSSRVFN